MGEWCIPPNALLREPCPHADPPSRGAEGRCLAMCLGLALLPGLLHSLRPSKGDKVMAATVSWSLGKEQRALPMLGAVQGRLLFSESKFGKGRRGERAS